MSSLRLALAYIRFRMLVTVLTVTSICLGIALAIVVLMLSHQTRDALSSETTYTDFVVGAKGGPLQLVLNSLYYLDAPTGNVNIAEWKRLEADPDVQSVTPLMMGDNYLGSPIVGTTPAFFVGRKPRRGDQLIAAGQPFAAPFEAVVGYDVARRNRVSLGQELVGAHGWAKSDDLHPQFPYKVVGILAQTGTALDRAVYTDYRSVWVVHSHPDADEKAAQQASGHDPSQEATALLVRLKQPARRFMMVQDINRNDNAMAVIPVNEINKLVTVFIAPIQGVLLIVAYLVVLVAALSILISLYLTIHQRRRDLAILRSLGATRGDVFRLITIEAAALAGLGVACGWLLAHGVIAAAAPRIMERFGIFPNAWQTQPVELLVAASVWLLGIMAGLLPAGIAYRVSVADTLAKE